jgi:hypothetical protein
MLLWIDGFDSYGATAESAPSPSTILQRKYLSYVNTYSDIKIGAGRLSGYSLKMPLETEGAAYIGTPVLTTDPTLIIGGAFKFVRYDATTQPFLTLYDGATRGVNIRWTPTGQFAIYNQDTLLGTTGGTALSTGIWYYVEFKIYCHESAGTYEVHVGEVSVGSGSSLDTMAGSDSFYDRVRITGCYGSSYYIDDFYICDSTGAANNDFLGNVRVQALRPSAAGDSTQLTPSTGDNYTCVDEEVCNDDTDYVESGTVGHKDLYTFGDTTVSHVKGVMVCTDCRETDATSFSLTTVCKSGATESDDSAQPIGTTSFITKRRLLETDPNTATAWTVSDLNAAQFGVKVS